MQLIIEAMKTFPGSSEQTALPPLSQADPLSVAVLDKLAALATDDPLPLTYTRDRLRLLVQSPHRIYLYWNFRENPFVAIRRAFGSRAAAFRFGVRLLDLTNGGAEFAQAWADETGRGGEYWFNAAHDTTYAAQIGFLTDKDVFIRLLSSGTVHTPRISVSPHVDATPDFKAPTEEFGRLLAESGYERDAFAMRLEAADEASGGAVSRKLTEVLIGTQGAEFKSLSESELRLLLLALAANEPLDTVNLSLGLRAKLRQQIEAQNVEDLRRRLAAVLNLQTDEFLEFEFSDFATHVWSSFSLGASRVRLPRVNRRGWLPSLNHELLATIGRVQPIISIKNNE